MVVYTASSGADALDTVRRQRIGAVVTDISMPGQDGLELLGVIRKWDLDLPVILMTGAPELDTAMRAVELGALKYVSKPFKGEDLVRDVRRALSLYTLARAKRELMAHLGKTVGEGTDATGLASAFERFLSGLWMAYQPIIAADGTLYGYEALLRSEDATLPHPGAMLDAAVRLDRLPELGRAIRDRIRQDVQRADPSWRIFVNLHPRDLEDPALVDPATDAFHDFPPNVVIEITERAALKSIDDVRAKVEVLRSHGHTIAIDDLGAGYSGLSSIIDAQPDVVKFDMGLIRGIHLDPVRRKLVGSMVAMFKELGTVVVAEGIEEPGERDVVIELGCDLLQGYLLGRPARPFSTPVYS